MTPVTEDEVRHLLHEWGHLHDEHAPLSSFLPIIVEEGFEIRFGDVLWQGYAGLEAYQEIKRQFFDEAHKYQWIDVNTAGDQAEAKSVTQWEASIREAPAPRSIRIKAVIHSSWFIKRSPRTGKPVIARTVVDSFKYVPGFEAPAAKAPPPHLAPPK